MIHHSSNNKDTAQYHHHYLVRLQFVINGCSRMYTTFTILTKSMNANYKFKPRKKCRTEWSSWFGRVAIVCSLSPSKWEMTWHAKPNLRRQHLSWKYDWQRWEIQLITKENYMGVLKKFDSLLIIFHRSHFFSLTKNRSQDQKTNICRTGHRMRINLCNIVQLSEPLNSRLAS